MLTLLLNCKSETKSRVWNVDNPGLSAALKALICFVWIPGLIVRIVKKKQSKSIKSSGSCLVIYIGFPKSQFSITYLSRQIPAVDPLYFSSSIIMRLSPDISIDAALTPAYRRCVAAAAPLPFHSRSGFMLHWRAGARGLCLPDPLNAPAALPVRLSGVHTWFV